jgi:prepilin peptidase CpaA
LTIDARSLAVIAVALAGCVSDIRTRRIPNALTFGAAGVALGFSFVQYGTAGLAWSAAGWLTAVALFFPFFLLRGMGGGDVKLLGALGAWVGLVNSFYLACFTALAGGVIALLVMASRRYLVQAFRNLWLLLIFWRTVGVRPFGELTLTGSQGPKLAYAIPIAVGALTTLWLR